MTALKPLLSVCLITYNHKNYIEQAVNSALTQQVDFPIEIIIADDCSTDGTTEIIKRLAAENSVIRLLLREKNIGAALNFHELIIAPTGKYFAYLEGDDYWTDPQKLQKQVEFLEANESCVMSSHSSGCLTNNNRLTEFNKSTIYNNKPYHNIFTIEDYIINDFFHSSSMVIRCDKLPLFPDWYCDVFSGDYFLVLFLTQKGNIHYINYSMSVYRYNPTSISSYSTRWEIFANSEKYLGLFNEMSGYRFRNKINQRLTYIQYLIYYNEKNYLNKITFYLKNIFTIWKMGNYPISFASKFKYFIPAQLTRSYHDNNFKNKKN